MFHPFRIHAADLFLFGDDLVERLVQVLQDFLFIGIVRRSDVGGALERHVLEHVSHTGGADHLVGTADVYVRHEGHDGHLVALQDDDVDAVGKLELGDGLFRLGQQGGGQAAGQDNPPIDNVCGELRWGLLKGNLDRLYDRFDLLGYGHPYFF